MSCSCIISHQRIFLLQWIGTNTKTYNQKMCRVQVFETLSKCPKWDVTIKFFPSWFRKLCGIEDKKKMCKSQWEMEAMKETRSSGHFRASIMWLDKGCRSIHRACPSLRRSCPSTKEGSRPKITPLTQKLSPTDNDLWRKYCFHQWSSTWYTKHSY